MRSIKTKDGVELFYKDWGKGQPIVFSHGWPLSADAWEDQMLFLASRRYRCIAHDRRGHGRSSQTWNGNDMNTYADDLATLFETLDLKDAVHVGHSTGANVFAAAQIAKRIQRGCVVTIACDRGDRYFAPMRWEKHYEW